MNLKVKDLENINTEEESKMGYIFQNKAGNDAKNLKDLQRINFFIGANNSGKSRFLRSLFQKEIKHIFSVSEMDDISKKMISSHQSEFLNFTEENSSSTRSNFEGFLDVDYSAKKESNGKDLSLGEKFAFFVKDKFNNHDFLRDEFLKSRMPDNSRIENFLIPGIQEINKKYIKMADPLNPCLLNYLYIPVIRGLRPLILNENCYKKRTEDDYFKDYLKPSDPKEIFTGLELYEDLKRHLLGYAEDRQIIKKYEEFLSENFFENKPVNLVPHIDSDVLHIKIGDEKDYPIHEVGDGIQHLIIMTYPLFKNSGKNMFVFIEEPEIFLHPGLQRRFVEILQSEKFDNFKFFIATHSNNLLDISLETNEKNISIYTFEKNEKDQKFLVKNVVSGDNNILYLLGVNNSSLFMSNCSIWVEGITDRIYLKSYLKAYQENLKNSGEEDFVLKEGIHYSFFEYAGSNLSHYVFDDSQTELISKIEGQFLSNKIFLIADNDEKKEGKHNTYANMSSKSNGKFIYKNLDVREVENLLSESLLKDSLKQIIPNIGSKVDEIKIEADFFHSYIGKYIVEKIGKGVLPESFLAKSGTIGSYYKLKLAEEVSKIVNWENMSEKARALTKEVLEFIKKSNSFQN